MSTHASHITSSQIHAEGAKRFGDRWLVANQTAIHAATRLGIDYTKLDNKLLIALVTLHVMVTFLDKKSPYVAVQRVNLPSEDQSEYESESSIRPG